MVFKGDERLLFNNVGIFILGDEKQTFNLNIYEDEMLAS